MSLGSKLGLTAFALLMVAVIATVAVVITSNEDSTGDAIRACAKKQEITPILAPSSLGLAGTDLQTGKVTVTSQIPLQGGKQASIMAPADGFYTIVAVTRKPESPALVMSQVAAAPQNLVLVFQTRSPAIARALQACVQAQTA